MVLVVWPGGSNDHSAAPITVSAMENTTPPCSTPPGLCRCSPASSRPAAVPFCGGALKCRPMTLANGCRGGPLCAMSRPPQRNDQLRAVHVPLQGEVGALGRGKETLAQCLLQHVVLMLEQGML